MTMGILSSVPPLGKFSLTKGRCLTIKETFKMLFSGFGSYTDATGKKDK